MSIRTCPLKSWWKHCNRSGVLQNAPLGELALAELELTPLAVESDIAKFELTLAMAETATGLTATLEYNRDIFRAVAGSDRQRACAANRRLAAADCGRAAATGRVE